MQCAQWTSVWLQSFHFFFFWKKTPLFFKHLDNCSNSSPSNTYGWTISICLPLLMNQTVKRVFLDVTKAVSWGHWITVKLTVTTSCHKMHTYVYLTEANMEVGFPGGSDGKESAYNVGDLSLISGSGWFPWRRNWQPTPVFLPGESHRQRSLADHGVTKSWTRLSIYMTWTWK